jgi:predicted negative regulator of RcsB-dependent stress response
VARITRKELKTDRFAQEVGHTESFFEDHQKELIRYGAAGIVVILLIVGYSIYARRQHTQREDVLARAIQVQESPVGPNPGQGQSFPTQEAKDEVALKAFGDLASKYPGSEEGEIAQYYLGSIKADQGKLAEAEKSFKEVADKGDAKYASLSKFALAQIYFADGRDTQGESTLRDLMKNPTIYISKEQATISLARFIAHKNPVEARNLLDPLRSQPGDVGRTALQAYGELPPGK